jgi:uncharacterized membrane protein YdjX (TVP38/TMEM64 family)
MSKPETRRTAAILAFPLLIAVLIVPTVIFRHEIWRLFTSAERLREWISASGAVAPLVFVAVQAVQVIVFVIPGEVPQIAGGYLFGIWAGTLLSITGIIAGSAVSFFLSRMLGVPFVRALFPREQVEKIEKLLASPRSKTVFFLLFVIPGVPKDVLCYVAGLSPMRFPFFLLASLIGRLPGILGSSIIGNAAAGEKWLLAGIVFGAAVALFAAGYFLRTRIEKWLAKFSRGKKGNGGESS